MSQAMDAMQSNPALRQQAERMMQDPAALARESPMSMESAMQAGLRASVEQGRQDYAPRAGLSSQVPHIPGQIPPRAPTNSAAGGYAVHADAGGGSRDDRQEMSEDDMLAEALRRSMEES